MNFDPVVIELRMAGAGSGNVVHSSHLPSVRRPSGERERQNEVKKKEIYKYLAPWTVYAMNWSVRQDKRFRIAIGSFIEDYRNKVQIIQLDEERGEFVLRASFEHPYPPTKIMWVPDQVTVFFVYGVLPSYNVIGGSVARHRGYCWGLSKAMASY